MKFAFVSSFVSLVVFSSIFSVQKSKSADEFLLPLANCTVDLSTPEAENFKGRVFEEFSLHLDVAPAVEAVKTQKFDGPRMSALWTISYPDRGTKSSKFDQLTVKATAEFLKSSIQAEGTDYLMNFEAKALSPENHGVELSVNIGLLDDGIFNNTYQRDAILYIKDLGTNEEELFLSHCTVSLKY